ncbi:MAG: CbiX/SirB N-terminal domain-containing protein [Planctomycetota bacterium]|nr:CbiX/SirB N-terminal domain-containing protein [Planctomycetota bacterium]MCX8040558.1 CbiX/SirB N-terminal domain-containing protein [Planctomycetota bacterium]MDW8372178.1 CbiX/SirB N-terminal domain-containing protein [Planctomycetota bacterium]
MTTTVLLIGHGSRAPAAAAAMERVARCLAERQGWRVAVGYLELSEPALEQAAQRAIAEGARELLVVPYLLHLGMHIAEDLPRRLRALAEAHPGVLIRLGPHLGFDERLVDIVADRARAAAAAPEIGAAAR